MKKQYMDQFQEIFESESLRGERIHWEMNWFLYTIILILSSFVYFIGHNEAGKYGLILSVVNLLYNALITYYIFKRKSVRRLSYITIFLNVLSLTIYTYMDAVSTSTIVSVTTAAILLFPVIIFLSSLRMDKYLILWALVLSVISMNGLYFWFYSSFDPYIVKQNISTDIFSECYRTIYIIIIGILVYSVPRSMRRVLRKQEQLAKESFESEQKAMHDSLTGLYNRLYFERQLPIYIEKAKDSNHKLGLLFIDLDEFKKINDTYGHDLGDYVLKFIAEDISSILGDKGMAARIGGDEFVIVMPHIADPYEVQDFSSKVLSAISRKRMYEKVELFTGASIGVSIYPDDAENPNELLKYADEAMYKVKRSGKS